MPLAFDILKYVPSDHQPYRPLKGEAPEDCAILDLSIDDDMDVDEEVATDLADAKSSTEGQATDLACAKSTIPVIPIKSMMDVDEEVADAKSSTEGQATDLACAKSTIPVIPIKSMMDVDEEVATDLADAKPSTEGQDTDLACAKSKTLNKTTDLADAKSSTQKPAASKSSKSTVASQSKVFCTTSKKKRLPKLNNKVFKSFNAPSYYEKKKPAKVPLDMQKLRTFAKTVSEKYNFTEKVRIFTSCLRVYIAFSFQSCH